MFLKIFMLLFLFNICCASDDDIRGFQDYKKMVHLYRNAAKQGHAEAQFHLGVMYENGQGVSQDYNEAANWYHKAAEQENARAQYNLGLMYANGLGVTQDYNEAVKWFLKAAEQGESVAQFNLGVMYENGQGVSKDYNEAANWYRKAAESTDVLSDGNYQSQRSVYDLSGCNYDELNAMYATGKTKCHEDEAIVALKKQLEVEDNPAVLELVGLLYEQKQDYENARNYLCQAIALNKRIFIGMDISYLPVFEELQRVQSNFK